MYKLSDFTQCNNEFNHQAGFIQCLKTKWDRIHRETNVFRYKIENLQERIVNNKYLVQLNPDRSTKRRLPEQIENICQPFDKDKFNFTKVSADEIILTFVSENTDLCEHFLIVNVSPISQYHSLLCPSMLKCLPQVVTSESLQLIIDIFFLTKDRNFKIGFNSLCGLASVNHLHYHLFIEKNVLPVEKAKCHHLKGPVFCLHDYLVPGFCFEITLEPLNQCDDVFKLIQVLLNQSIAHNIFITWGQSLTSNINGEVVRVIIWPRKSSSGAKQLAAFNVAVCELSGWFPVYVVWALLSRELFHKMKLLIIVLFTLFVLIKFNECTQKWFPQNLVQTIAKETSLIKDYVQEKGRNMKNYVNNVQNKISSYFGLMYEHAKVQENEGKQGRIKRKFKDYIQDAQAKDNVIFDSIAPKIDGDPCSTDDPSIHMTTPQLIALHGYFAESHTIVTDDGYILTLHRIPHSKNVTGTAPHRKTVLLHHGLLGSSADWIISGPKKSLAYILSNAGYDVWLANVRGNTYSRAHVSKNPDTFAFWNFTFHDVSQHDLPAIIDYIMEKKGWDVKINYIGHSMGTTILFALLSTKTEYNKVLRAGYALAPVAFMTNVRSPIRLLARFSDNIAYLMKLLGANEFLPQNAVLRWLSKHACEINHYEEAICENSMFVLCGHDEKQFNKTLLPIILGHVPAGASTKTLIHYAQEIRNGGRFQQFDYGRDGNYRVYGSPIPPEYPIYKITLPIALLSSDNDWLAGEEDVSNLYARLANPLEHYVIPFKDFNHLDFLWAIDAPKLVYNKLLQLLEDGINKPYTNFQSNNEIN